MERIPEHAEQSEEQSLSSALHGPILGLLKTHSDGLSIHHLVSVLKLNEGAGLEVESDSQLSIFRINFLVMNALFYLQRKLAEEGYGLEISSLMVRMYPISGTASSQALGSSANARLSDYYLDWKNLEETSETDITVMLDAFWERYWNFEKADEALEVLDLDREDADETRIRQAFRRLASVHHPDKGGEAVEFLKIREAYESLMTRKGFSGHQ